MIPADWQKDIALSMCTTFKIGGKAQYLTKVRCLSQLFMSIDYAYTNNISITVLGSGSNVLVSDSGVSGLVVIMDTHKREVLEESDSDVLISLSAGEVLDEVIEWTVANGWWGLENLSSIPGTVGATPIQNVGAYGVEVADVIEYVTVYDYKTRKLKNMSVSQCCFGYRTSIFKELDCSHLIIVSVVVRLLKKPNPKLSYTDLRLLSDKEYVTQSEIRKWVCKVRSSKFPDWTKVGTAGSFFRNPIISKEHYQRLLSTYQNMPHYKIDEENVKVPLGWILDHVCGLRGYMKGCVGTYEKQALVIIQNGGARAFDIDQLSRYIQQEVYRKTNINISEEVTRIPK